MQVRMGDDEILVLDRLCEDMGANRSEVIRGLVVKAARSWETDMTEGGNDMTGHDELDEVLDRKVDAEVDEEIEGRAGDIKPGKGFSKEDQLKWKHVKKVSK